MHYYKRNLGDYYKRAGRLSMIEHGAYTLLIDASIDRERCPRDEDEAAAWCGARTTEEREAVSAVLALMFAKTADGYTNELIDAALLSYAAKCATNASIAQAREGTKRARVVNETCTTGDETCTKHHLTKELSNSITNNQEKDKDKDKDKPRKKRGAAAQLVGIEQLVAEGVDKTHAADWLAVRKEKRLPLTQTSWDAVKDEALKAGITPAEAVKVSAERPWAGFKASWLAEKQVSGGVVASPNLNRQEALEARNRAVADRWLESMGAI